MINDKCLMDLQGKKGFLCYNLSLKMFFFGVEAAKMFCKKKGFVFSHVGNFQNKQDLYLLTYIPLLYRPAFINKKTSGQLSGKPRL